MNTPNRTPRALTPASDLLSQSSSAPLSQRTNLADALEEWQQLLSRARLRDVAYEQLDCVGCAPRGRGLATLIMPSTTYVADSVVCIG